MIASSVAKRYARALFSLAREANQVDAIGRGLTGFAEAWATSPELRTVFENPAHGLEVRKNVVVSVAQRLGAAPVLVSTLQLLTERNRLRFVGEIADAYRALAEETNGVLRAEIITAGELPEAYFARLEKTLADATGKKVVLVKKKDPALLGGVVTKIGDRVYDGSLRARLYDLRSQMLTNATHSGTTPEGR
jgi:F-type H+-transporting ATPase subunit delta